MSDELTIGIDIGGTKVALVMADRNGNILEQQTLPTLGSGGAATVIDRVASETNRYIERHRGICGIGIGVPGPIDTRHGIALRAVNLGWENVPIRESFSKRITRPLPIYLDNDVNVGVIGEQLFGVAKGVRDYVYLTVGTGLGGAVMLNNRLMRGATSSEMEIGHVSLDPVNGRECTCGMRGCVEMSASGKGIIANALQHLSEFPASGLHAGDVTTHEIIRLAAARDPLACFVLKEAATALGIACAWCVNLFNPQQIILGGGLIHASYHLLEEQLQLTLRERCLPLNYQSVKLSLSRLTDAALGASALVWYHQDQEC